MTYSFNNKNYATIFTYHSAIHSTERPCKIRIAHNRVVSNQSKQQLTASSSQINARQRVYSSVFFFTTTIIECTLFDLCQFHAFGSNYFQLWSHLAFIILFCFHVQTWSKQNAITHELIHSHIHTRTIGMKIKTKKIRPINTSHTNHSTIKQRYVFDATRLNMRIDLFCFPLKFPLIAQLLAILNSALNPHSQNHIKCLSAWWISQHCYTDFQQVA